MNISGLKRRHFLWIILFVYLASLLFHSQMASQRRADEQFGLPKYVFGDGQYYILLTYTLLNQHRLYIYDGRGSIRNTLMESAFSLGRDGRVYITFSPLYSVVLAPAYAIAGILGAYILNALIGVATCYFIYKTCRLFVSEESAVDTTLLFAFGTIIFTYSQVIYAEDMTALLTIASFYFAAKYEKDGGKPRLVCSGLLSGALLLAKPSLAIVPLSIAVYHAYKNRLKDMPFLVAPMALAALIYLGLNAASFGSPLKTGYSSEIIIRGAERTTVDHGDARFWSNNPLRTAPLIILLLVATQPILAVSILGMIKNMRADETKYAALTTAVLLLALSLRYNPLGYWCWSTRLLTPVIPLLAIPFALAYEKKQVGGGVVLTLAVISVALTLFSLAPISWHLFTQLPITSWITYNPYT